MSKSSRPFLYNESLYTKNFLDLHYYREMKHAWMFLLYVFLLCLTCQKVGLSTMNLRWTGYQAVLFRRISGTSWIQLFISGNRLYPVLHCLSTRIRRRIPDTWHQISVRLDTSWMLDTKFYTQPDTGYPAQPDNQSIPNYNYIFRTLFNSNVAFHA